MVAGTRVVFWYGPELVRGFDETTIALLDTETLLMCASERAAFGHPALPRKLLERALAIGIRDATMRERAQSWVAAHPQSADPVLEDADALVDATRAAIGRNQLDEAEALATRAVAAATTNPHAWVVRGLVKQAKGDLAGALADASQAVELWPTLLRGRSARATIASAAGDMKRALSDVSAALTYHPRDAQAWQLAAMIRRRAGDYNGALAACAQAFACEVPEPSSVYTLATISIDAGREATGRALMELAAAGDESRPHVRYAREWLDQHPPR